MLKFAVAVIAVMLVAGCASMSGGPNMSVDQLKAIAADKNAGVVCSKIMGPWGTGVVVVSNLDQRVIQDGSVTVDGASCNTTITNAVHDKAVSAPVVAAPKPVVATP